MFTKARILLLFALLLGYLCFSQTKSDKHWQIAPYFGLSSPFDDFENVSSRGSVYGLAIDKYLSSRFALGIDLNYQTTDFKNPFDFSSISDPISGLSNAENKWSTITMSFGPTYRFGSKKINAELYVKGGLSFLKSPLQESYITTSDGREIIFFELNEVTKSDFGLTSGIRLNFAISKRLSFFINPQYVFGGSEVEYFYRDFPAELQNNPDALGQDGGELFYVKPSYINVNAGINFSITGKEGNNNERTYSENDVLEQKTCRPSKLMSPENGKTFYLDSKERPQFKWTNSEIGSLRHNIFRIYDDNDQIIYKKETSKKSLKHNGELEKIYKKTFKVKTQLYWNVESVYSDCPKVISGTQSFNGSRSIDGFSVGISDLKCDLPAYDQNGNIRITGKIELKVPAYNTSPVQINFPMDLIDVTTGNVVASLVASDMIPCQSSIIPSSPFVINQGSNGDIEFCFKKEVPFVVENIRVVANGFSTIGNNPLTNSSNLEMPDCACKTCETWEYISTKVTLNKINVAGFPFNYQIEQELQIIDVDPIMEVKAEIISVQHVANDPQCYTCTKQENNMGLFSFVPGFLQPRISGTSAQIEWNNGANAENRIVTDTDNYSGQAVWRAKDPSVGVDFNLMKHFILPISLPDSSSLDCCEHRYKVCVRYTFTDINCITCSYDRCYEYDGKTESINIDNPSDGLNNSDNKTPNTYLNKN